MIKWIVGGIAVILLVASFVVFHVIPVRFDSSNNSIHAEGSIEVDQVSSDLHKTLRVADLHTDTLLWMRDPAKRHSRGHVDLPRLQEGGVRLQVFSATTKSPSGQNYESNSGETDRVTSLVMVQRWPTSTWDSIYERAAYQARRLQRLEDRRGDEFLFVKSSEDLTSALNEGKVAGIYLIEGAHPLEGKIENLDRLFDEGLRVVGLQHFFDNELGGSLHGLSKTGLTPFGEDVVRRANEKSMIIDVAHSSEATVRDVLAITDSPLIVSHTGMKGHCNSPRNFSDELMKAIAEDGGLIGIGFWPDVVCGMRPSDIAASIVYAIETVGVEHVALGSDFDGAISAPFDVSNMSVITQALIEADLDEASIRAVMGENAIRFFEENLPANN